ncbi:hypothetical protein MTO96_007826 [Rhipicephalus appendiculatus]
MEPSKICMNGSHPRSDSAFSMHNGQYNLTQWIDVSRDGVRTTTMITTAIKYDDGVNGDGYMATATAQRRWRDHKDVDNDGTHSYSEKEDDVKYPRKKKRRDLME